MHAIHALREEHKFFELSSNKRNKRDVSGEADDKAFNTKEARKCCKCNTIGHLAFN
jgi:hypothetical protein